LTHLQALQATEDDKERIFTASEKKAKARAVKEEAKRLETERRQAEREKKQADEAEAALKATAHEAELEEQRRCAEAEERMAKAHREEEHRIRGLSLVGVSDRIKQKRMGYLLSRVTYQETSEQVQDRRKFIRMQMSIERAKFLHSLSIEERETQLHELDPEDRADVIVAMTAGDREEAVTYMNDEDKEEIQDFLPPEFRERPEFSEEEDEEEESDQEDDDEEDEMPEEVEEDAGDATATNQPKKVPQGGTGQDFLNTKLLGVGMLFAGTSKGERSGIYKTKKDVEVDMFDDV